MSSSQHPTASSSDTLGWTERIPDDEIRRFKKYTINMKADDLLLQPYTDQDDESAPSRLWALSATENTQTDEAKAILDAEQHTYTHGDRVLLQWPGVDDTQDLTWNGNHLSALDLMLPETTEKIRSWFESLPTSDLPSQFDISANEEISGTFKARAFFRERSPVGSTPLDLNSPLMGSGEFIRVPCTAHITGKLRQIVTLTRALCLPAPWIEDLYLDRDQDHVRTSIFTRRNNPIVDSVIGLDPEVSLDLNRSFSHTILRFPIRLRLERDDWSCSASVT
nr:uncharacterized protein CI109_005504 [Kwoniella shandongensis]KAA5526072.1 hypothetical protein CI109_005504 [Kwoniella shandongensis]